MANKMKLERALEVLEYNKAMLTCDMSITRDPEHQDVSPDYYGKEAEDLYYAIVCAEEYIKNAILIEWIEKKLNCCDNINAEIFVKSLIRDWRKENGRS